MQRQLDSVARRRSLEMHQFQQQQQQHRQEQHEWLEERRALQEKLEEAVADLARAQCEESDAKDKMQKLVEALKGAQAAAASAANQADKTITQLQGMLALCRKARTAQSPIKAAHAQQVRVIALQEQVSALEHTLQQATRSLGLHSSLLRDGPGGVRPWHTTCSEGRQEKGSHVAPAHRADTAQSAKRDLPVFERLLQAAANLSVEQVRLLSLGDGAHKEMAVDWADAERNVAAQMRQLLHCIVAASNEAGALDDALAASRAREIALEEQVDKMQRRGAHAAVDASKSLVSHVITPVPCGTDLKREREHETDEEMAIKVLAARATAQNEKAKRKALERKMRACTRELDSRKRLTPKRAPSREEGSQVLSPGGALRAEHSPSSQRMRQFSHARSEHARYRSGWKPNVTQVLEAAAGRRPKPQLSWHIEVCNKQTQPQPQTQTQTQTQGTGGFGGGECVLQHASCLEQRGQHCPPAAMRKHRMSTMRLAAPWTAS